METLPVVVLALVVAKVVRDYVKERRKKQLVIELLRGLR